MKSGTLYFIAAFLLFAFIFFSMDYFLLIIQNLSLIYKH